MSRSTFELKMKTNMDKLKKLQKLSKTIKFKKQKHHPKSKQLPKMPMLEVSPSVEMDIEELKALKMLILNDDVTVIEKLADCRHIVANTKQELLNHYINESSPYSKFRLNMRNQISYRCGYFYNIDEDFETIITFDAEVLPAIFAKLKIFTAHTLKKHHMTNSINMLSCNKLKPKYISIHIPTK